MPPNNSGCAHQPLGGGNAREESSQLEHKGTTADTTSVTSLTRQQQRLRRQESENDTSTVVSARASKRTTSNAKNKPPKKRTRTTKLSQTSDQASILKGRDCYGWWTKSCEETSKKLWFPTETDFADLPSTSSSGCVTETAPISWSKIKKYTPRNQSSQKTLWQLYTSSRVGTTGCGGTSAKTNKITRCEKVRLYPTPQQARILRQWMMDARHTYNRANRLVKEKKAKPNKVLKKLVVTEREEDSLKIKQIKQRTPADIRVRAVFDLIDAYKTAGAGCRARLARQKKSKSKWKKRKKKEKPKKRRRWKKRKPFEVKYKTRRVTTDSFGFESKSVRVKDGQLYLFSKSNKFGMKEGIRMSNVLVHPLSSCCRVQCFYGRWYFILPYNCEKPKEPRVNRFVALDPGIRTFQTYYTDDEAGEIGCDMEKKIDQVNKKIKGIQSLLKWSSGCDPRKTRRLQKAWYRANARSSNLVTDFHWKVAKYLLDKYDVVVAPRLNVTSLLKTDLPDIVKERMVTQRHGIFLSRLKMKADTRGKVVVTDFEEHGTSMTCSNCGEANRDLGSSKYFKCVRCEFEGDRDVNSAKNHVLKFLVGDKNY